MVLADQDMAPLGEIENMQHWDLSSRIPDSAPWERLSLVRLPGQLEDTHIVLPLFVRCPLPGVLSHLGLKPNRMLIVCVPMNQVFTHTIQKIDTE
jgi:hypothetical protein